MRQCNLLSMIFIASAISVFAQEGNLVKLEIGDEAPQLVTFDIYEDIFNSNEILSEKMLLVSFFGTYCRPCIAEFPEIIRLYSQYSKDLTVVMVNKGMEGRDELKQFQNKHNLNNFTVVRDRFGNIGDPYGVRAVPVTILIGKSGKVLYVKYGTFENGTLYRTLSPIIMSRLNE